MDFITLRYEFDWGIPFREPFLGWLITGVKLTLLITAVSTGLNRFQQMRYIMLPEAFRIILPALTVRMIHNFKNSSICMAVAAPELTWATQQVESITFRGIETTFLATVFYVVISLTAAAGILRLERLLKIDLTSINRMRT